MDRTSSIIVMCILQLIIVCGVGRLMYWIMLEDAIWSLRFRQCLAKKDYFQFRKLLKAHPQWNCDVSDPLILDPWNRIIEMHDNEAANRFFEIGLSMSPTKTINQSILDFAAEHDFQFSPAVMGLCNEYVDQKQSSD